MSFFDNLSSMEIFGLILLIAGALVTFLSEKIASGLKLKNKTAALIVKIIGAAIAFAAVVMIFAG